MEIGISGYGAYIPRLRIKVDEIAKVWGQNADAIKNGLLVEEKSVPEADEDTITISVQAGRNALLRAGISGKNVDALFIGSESHPYAVKPSGTVVADVLGMTPNVLVADYEFACKAGTAGIQTCYGLAKAGELDYGMAIGADTAQGQPGDALEYTAAAGGAAFVVGKNPVAIIEGIYSYTTDTPDFWRREGQDYPKHAGRFTGDPAYFHHITSATRGLLEKLGTKPSDYKYAALHTPNGKFPLRAGKILGFSNEQLKYNMIVQKIGNTYSGASMLVLTHILDNAKAGDRILMTSYGSGAGSDSFSIRVTDRIEEAKNRAPKTEFYINRKSYVDYGIYAKLRGKIKL
ncbi:MAG: hydroxymethylglutaryl-CoA synthase [Candidatus Aenigmarchaeota archaeon]|nr:hydroxymethylglutaryl-CoA synthase [Candidatus Aenigmarchaeota archaeon]MDI6722320.1 hydroxymethylglutaryl-CoA synthase [Candidatus Aenigmarchaeota archaeon]